MTNPAGPSRRSFGVALGEPFAVPGGSLTLHTAGLRLLDREGALTAEVAFPMVGRPWISTGNGSALDCDLHVPAGGVAGAESLLRRALDQRVGLFPTGAAGAPADSSVVALAGDAAPTRGRVTFGGDLAERQLYDVVVRDGSGAWQVVAPHAAYQRSSWSDFGLAHITDMHVARRIDQFRPTLVKLGRAEAAAAMYNWNDRFRGFVRYANFLHDTGALDVIVATGDCYDFEFEDDDDPALATPGSSATFCLAARRARTSPTSRSCGFRSSWFPATTTTGSTPTSSPSTCTSRARTSNGSRTSPATTCSTVTPTPWDRSCAATTSRSRTGARARPPARFASTLTSGRSGSAWLRWAPSC